MDFAKKYKDSQEKMFLDRWTLDYKIPEKYGIQIYPFRGSNGKGEIEHFMIYSTDPRHIKYLTMSWDKDHWCLICYVVCGSSEIVMSIKIVSHWDLVVELDQGIIDHVVQYLK
jgi:hypothetical protein